MKKLTKTGYSKNIQKSITIFLSLIVFTFITVYLMNNRFSEKPYNLLGNKSIQQTE